MHRIIRKDDYLMVQFENDFDYCDIRTIIHDETQLPEYARMNDIWLIGKHRAQLSIEDLVSMVADFKCMCPRNATRQKTAVVVESGLTEAIVLLWIKEAENRIPFTCRVFHTIAEAEKWLGSSAPTVAQERAYSDIEREAHASPFSKFM